MTNDEIIEEAVKRLVDAAHPQRIILFGSYARNEATPSSDMDLLVVVGEEIDRRGEMVRLLKVLRGLPIPFDVLIFTDGDIEDWGNVQGTVLYPALREGIVLYDAA